MDFKPDQLFEEENGQENKIEPTRQNAPEEVRLQANSEGDNEDGTRRQQKISVLRKQIENSFGLDSTELVGGVLSEDQKTVYRKLEDFLNKPLPTGVSLLKERVKNSLGIAKEKWEKSGFSTDEELDERRGPFIEIGGPTKDGFELVDLKKLTKKLYQSNVFTNPEKVFMEPGTSTAELSRGKPKKVDFLADARDLPFADGSVGALFAAYLPRHVRQHFIQESGRVLEQGGLLVSEGLTKEDFESAAANGFELGGYVIHLADYGKRGRDYIVNAIFKKVGL